MSGAPTIPLEPVDALHITTLIDNVSDMLLQDQGPAKRAGFGDGDPPQLSAAFLDRPTADVPLAEHGFSALVSVAKGDQEHRLLFDAGITPDGLIGNMRRLSLDAKDIEAIVLSHGHFDHTTGIDGLVRQLGKTNLPVMIHPEFWSQRRVAIPGREPFELPSTSKSALVGAGFEIIEQRQPSFLFQNSLLITGEVDRTTEFEQGFPVHQALRDGEWQPDPLILDDQALIANVRGKGLVILTGCGHSGIVNIVRYARKLTGVDEVYAVLGGFHLSGPVFEPIIPATCEALAAFAPEVVVPAHCTGWRAVHALAATLPDAFIQNSVGTRFEL
ncbi:MAG: MBL fold metallo-hydrolase [Chloroflexi bacterium]|nr:MBL fold metallo-hydrolase [Chloroflexota bacterium]